MAHVGEWVATLTVIELLGPVLLRRLVLVLLLLLVVDQLVQRDGGGVLAGGGDHYRGVLESLGVKRF